MHSHQTFSLNTILNTYHLQPQIYEHMITEIKSPLQEQSFDLTNDNSYSYEQIPKRPNIPPAPPKSPLGRLNHDQFSRTYDSYFIDLAQSKRQLQEPIRDKSQVNVVSPLEYEINVKKNESLGIAGWCGRNVEKVIQVEDIEEEIQIPYRNSYYKRRPIFQKNETKSYVYQAPPQPVKPLKTLRQAIDALLRVDQPELAAFLELLGLLEIELKQMDSHKYEMIKDLDLIYQRLSEETNFSAQITERNDTHSRVLRRLRSRNSGQVIKKVFGRKHKAQVDAQQHLQKLFTKLHNIQIIISEFIQKPNSLEYINTVYAFLSNNFHNQMTFKHQLSRLYDYLGIHLDTNGLELIWQNCDQRKLDKNQFIEGLSLNTFVVRSHEGFQQELYMKGFRPNC